MNEFLKSLSEKEQHIVVLFMETEKQKAISNGIAFIMSDTERVDYFGRKVNGYFEAEMPMNDNFGPCMATAIGKPLDQWLQTFAHETSHMDQYLEKSPVWMSTQEYSICDKWLAGESFTQEEIQETIFKIILLEADCEKRTMEKIKKHNLPIILEVYAKRANAYLLFHHWMLDNKLWYNKAPYEIEAITKEMDSELHDLNYYLQRPSQKTMDLFELCR